MNKLFLTIALLVVLCVCVSAVHVSVDVEVANPHQQHHNTEHKHHSSRPFHALAEELAVAHSAPKHNEHVVSKPAEAEVDDAELDGADDESLIEAHKLPDPDITPGKPLASINLATLCKAGYTSKVRDVPSSVKNQVYRNYGITANQGFCKGPQGCEVDHLISLEIGGSNDVTNLWPQPYFGATNAHNKDQLENKLHSLVCAKTITLQEAQDAISSNWIDAYNKYVGPLN